jgi:hypothetical protein
LGEEREEEEKKNISKKETIITFARTDFYRLITFRVHNDGALRPIMPYVYDETPSGLCTYCIYCSAPEEQKKSRGDEMYAQTLDGERCPIQRKKKIQRKTGCCNFIASTTDSTKLEMGIGPVRRKSACILPAITKNDSIFRARLYGAV